MSDIVPLHVATPFIEDIATSAAIGREVWLKMECFQPIGSFKIRGVGMLCQRSVSLGKTHLVSSSGGNAGMAVAYAARKLKVRATVVVPSTTAAATQTALRQHGATVIVHGDVWDEADSLARELATAADAVYVPPFDHPVLWEGHASLVAELLAAGCKPDAVVVAVGGGGLFCGVLEGLHRCGWQDVNVIAVETLGAESFHRSVQQGRAVTLDAITSIAKSLGARRVCDEALRWTQRHSIRSVVVSDDAALDASVRFALEHRVLVEVACGAALSVVYENHESLGNAKSVAVVVCGGISVGPVVDRLRATRSSGGG